jgi:chromosome segregation ATPase
MSSNRKFHYSLAPVLLTRQWNLDALLSDLNRIASELSAKKNALSALQRDMEIACNEWKTHSDDMHGVTVDRYRVLMRYLGDLAGQCLAKEKEIDALEEERNQMIDRVATAKRAVEAIEQHRDDMRSEFMKEKMSGDFRDIDDQWSTLRALLR